jgi:hypothetical protein
MAAREVPRAAREGGTRMAERLDTQTKQLRLLHAEFDATLARMVELQRELA